MIREHLESHFKIDKLRNVYLINTNNNSRAYEELKGFINEKLLGQNTSEYHADYLSVKKSDSKAKNISIDQIRELQEFLHKTSVISGKKVAVIYDADQMNINAANSCLKLLEESSVNSHIFLITENASSLPPTIISRCYKIDFRYSIVNDPEIGEKFLNLLLIETPIAEKIKFINDYIVKDREHWSELANFAEISINKFCRKLISADYILSEREAILFKQLTPCTINSLRRKYDQIKQIVNDANIYDLDLKASSILLIDKFCNV